MTVLNTKQNAELEEQVDEVLTAADDAAGHKKAPGAFRTISEVADELGVQQHVLRFWETKFTQVKPLKRGGGRRYYRPEDVALLKKIHTLLYTEGYTIKGVQKLLKTLGKAQLLAGDTGSTAPVAKRAVAANEVATPRATANVATAQPVGALPLNDKQRSILQAMLGDLRDLRDMIGTK